MGTYPTNFCEALECHSLETTQPSHQQTECSEGSYSWLLNEKQQDMEIRHGGRVSVCMFISGCWTLLQGTSVCPLWLPYCRPHLRANLAPSLTEWGLSHKSEPEEGPRIWSQRGLCSGHQTRAIELLNWRAFKWKAKKMEVALKAPRGAHSQWTHLLPGVLWGQQDLGVKPNHIARQCFPSSTDMRWDPYFISVLVKLWVFV